LLLLLLFVGPMAWNNLPDYVRDQTLSSEQLQKEHSGGATVSGAQFIDHFGALFSLPLPSLPLVLEVGALEVGRLKP